MSRRSTYWLIFAILIACGRTDLDVSNTRFDTATGGVIASSNGGAPGVGQGGHTLTGGVNTTGGSSWRAFGGTTIATGGRATGGTQPTAGRAPTGGSAFTLVGGTTATGGTSFTMPSGGRTATGGTSFSMPSGGKTATGGTPSSGGTSFIVYDTGAKCTFGSCGPCSQCNTISQTCQPLTKGTACTKTDACFTSFSCDGAGNCQGDVPAPASVPVPMRPISGTRTGSPWAKGELTRLRPTFVWSDGAPSSCDGLTYDLQVDDSCEGIASCTFPSPEIAAKGLSKPTFTPMDDLAVNSSPPVGRRYAWRVRGCRNGTCSSWSSTRYVDVGRAPHDYNGDGYSDFTIGTAEGKAYVSFGSSSGLPSNLSEVALAPSDADLYRVAAGSTGDINGDGFSDLVVLHAHVSGRAQQINAYLGSATGLSPVSQWTNERSYRAALPLFAEADFNGDGYADLLANVGSDFSSAFEYFAGSANAFDSANSRFIGSGSAFDIERYQSGDFNGDALSDLIVHDVRLRVTFAYLSSNGIPDSPTVALTRTIEGEVPCIATVDQDMDNRDDLILVWGGVLYFFRGSTTGLPKLPGLTTSNSAVSNQYATDCTSGVLLGHPGVADLVVSDPGSLANGSIYVYEGGTNLFQWLGPVLRNTSPTVDAGYGTHLQIPGDLNGDGFDELVVCDQNTTGGRALVFSGPTATSSKGTSVLPPAGVASFCSGLY